MSQRPMSETTQLPDLHHERQRPEADPHHRIVLAGVDGSPASVAAVEWAAEEATRREGSLLLLHVCELPDEEHLQPCLVGHQQLATASAIAVAASPEVTVSTRLLHGRPADCLRSAATGVAMVVVGSPDLGQLRQTLFGTVTAELVAETSSPIAIVHAAAPDHPDGPVVVGCDTDGSSNAALEVAFAEAHSRAVELIVVHSWRAALVDGAFPYAPPLVLDISQLEQGAELALSALLSDCAARYPAVRVRQVVTSEGAVPAILELGSDAGLIVVGTRGRGPVSGLILGSTSRAVIAHSRCPVVVVPISDSAAVTE